MALGVALLASVVSVGDAAAQDFDVYGFVNTSVFYDTRQGVLAREGDAYLFPRRDPRPSVGTDAEDRDNLLFFPFLTRVGVHATDLPEAFGARIEASIETDFYGASSASLNALRLRRSFVQMTWGGREVLVGVEWSPLSTNAEPRSVGVDAGRPFQTFARQPQIRLTMRPGMFTIVGALSQQMDAFAERGVGGARQQQRAGVPAATFGGEFAYGGIRVGAGAHVKTVRPDGQGERYTAGHGQLYAALDWRRFRLIGKVIYGQSLSDFVMPGGYVSLLVPASNSLEYEPSTLGSAWLDFETATRTSVGLFAGYLESDGIDAALTTPTGTPRVATTRGMRAPDLADLWRVSPRVKMRSGAMTLGLEVEITSARYRPDTYTSEQPALDVNRVTNMRGIFSLSYHFSPATQP